MVLPSSETPGLVYNYDERGVHIDNNLTWPLCIAVDILSILKGYSTSVILKHWDRILREHSEKSEWTCDKYELILFHRSLIMLICLQLLCA